MAFLNLDNTNLGIKMQIIFKRRLTNEVLTTYLPTVLLILISYCTTFFKQFFFEAALTVNVTVMLVLTTLFISVMEKLPPTSYVRMVDIWLIFAILIPFLEVSILTFKEYHIVGDDQKINHHGQARKVSNIMENEVNGNGKLEENNYFPEEKKMHAKKKMFAYASFLGVEKYGTKKF